MLRGGPEAHQTYVSVHPVCCKKGKLIGSSALIAREEAEERFKRDKIQAAIAAGTRKHTRKPRPRRLAFYCCHDDGSLCYCKFCWEGQCECVSPLGLFGIHRADHGRENTRKIPRDDSDGKARSVCEVSGSRRGP